MSTSGRRFLARSILTACLFTLAASLVATTRAEAGTGGRFTFLRDDGSYWGVTFPGSGYEEIPFEIDTDGNGSQELAVYYGGRMTIRRDDGSLWGFNFYGGGMGEAPLAVCRQPDPAHPGLRGCKQKFAVYYRGRFTFLHDDGSYDGVTFPGGADRLDLPLAVDTDGSGYQRPAVYRNGRFTFLNPDGSIWGVTFAGATASDIPFAIDTDGVHGQELAVYRNGRVTIRRDDGTYWGFNFQGAGIDDIPMAVDTNRDGRQEFAVYNHRSRQLAAKQILGNPRIDLTDYGNGSGRLVLQDLQLTADGGAGTSGVRLSTTLLELVDYLAQSHTIELNALESGGTGHSPGSAHYIGEAVDFGKLDGTVLTGRNGPSVTLINALKYLLPPGSSSAGDRNTTGFGQSNCGATPALPAGVASFADSCNHLHMQLTQSTP